MSLGNKYFPFEKWEHIISPLIRGTKGDKLFYIPLNPSSRGGQALIKGGVRIRRMTNKKLITTGYHLPYNPSLVKRAKELRKNMTLAEKKLWYYYLRSFSFQVLRQRPIDNYIVDFYCPKLKLVIEIDGETHISEKDRKYDEKRTKTLEGYELKVLRFWNYDVLDGFDMTCEIIGEIALKYSPQPPLLKGEKKD